MTWNKYQRAKAARARLAAKGGRPWAYDPVANKYELHPEQLANLRIGAALKASQARETRQRVAVLHSRGHGAADIVLLTGISRATVYRWLATLRDPLLL